MQFEVQTMTHPNASTSRCLSLPDGLLFHSSLAGIIYFHSTFNNQPTVQEALKQPQIFRTISDWLIGRTIDDSNEIGRPSAPASDGRADRLDKPTG
jgi:hypothetical protein